MKKRNNKTIVLIVIGIFFIVLFGIFILNYSKDDASFSILEKKWISDNTSNIIDVSVYNDVPVYGNKGKGVIFDLLNDFTDKYKINFNKVSYLSSSSSNLKTTAFRILNSNTEITDNDILLYEDSYVLVTNRDDAYIDRITDIDGIEIAVLSSDIGFVSSYLSDAKKVSYVSKDSLEEIETSIKNKEVEYAMIPYNMNLDFILENDLNIVYHLNDIAKKYVLTIENKTFLNIMKKFYKEFGTTMQTDSYKEHFLDEYFLDKNISEADRMGYNASSYTVGYITYMPYTDTEEKELVGTLSNYLSGFEDLFDVDLKVKYYNNIEEYFAYDADEYYQSLQMGLPALYYSGRENPPHPEIWFDYFLRMVELYSTKVCEISEENETQSLYTSLSHLRPREKEFLAFLLQNHIYEFTPIDVSKMLGITNRTVINRCTKLAENGFAVPAIVKERIRSYKLSDYSKLNEQEIQNKIIGGHQNDRNGTK